MSELESLIMRGFESKELDYKGPMAWNRDDKKSCCEVVKDILAMANTKGGFIVIGVAEEEKRFVPRGLSSDQLTSFESTILNQFIKKYADPPINCALRKIPCAGMDFVVVEVPVFRETPHLCIKDFPDVLSTHYLYVRTDTNASAPASSSSDLRQLADQAVRTRQDYLLSSFRGLLASEAPRTSVASFPKIYKEDVDEARARFEELYPYKTKTYRGFREAYFFPAHGLETKLPLNDLRSQAYSSSVDFAGWPFLYADRSLPGDVSAIQNGIEAAIPHQDFRLNDRFDYWRFLEDGMFFQKVVMWEDSYAAREAIPCFIEFDEISIYCGLALDCLTRLYDGLLAPDDAVTAQIKLLGMDDRSVFSLNRIPPRSAHICRMPEIFVKETHSLAEWKAGLQDHAAQMSADIQLRMNFAGPQMGAIQNTLRLLFERRLG